MNSSKYHDGTDSKPVPAGVDLLPDDLEIWAIGRLSAWAKWAERWWYEPPTLPAAGCFGTGYDRWGTQTNQKYIAAMATLSQRGPEADRPWALQRALAALRYELATHHSGSARRVDGSQWGRYWLSALGIERMMHGWPALEAEADQAIHDALRRVLLDEAAWSANEFERGSYRGVLADRWASSGQNNPESNIWEGALLWRVASMYPDDPRAEHFRDMAHRFLINGVSIAADAEDATPVAGRPVCEWHVGANFFDHYTLDHHGYLNVGYMAICMSNAAMLHFDLKRLDLPRPTSLDHHQHDLWQALRPMIFDDGRLARIGGDSRIAYTYCHEYLVPVLLYAADHFGDAEPLALLRQTAAICETECRDNADGSFLGKRLAKLAAEQPYYYTRLESDRACALSMLAAYLPLLSAASRIDTPAEGSLNHAITAWAEPEHGAILHRSPTRLASVAWRGFAGPQFLCLPPNAGDLADWQHNLAGYVRCLGDEPGRPNRHRMRRPLVHAQQAFDGGFITVAAVAEGDQNEVPEGLTLRHQATSTYAVTVLPDGHTMLIVHRCVAEKRIFTHEVVGLNLAIPNDVFNGFERCLTTSAGTRTLKSPPEADERIDLEGCWLNVDNRLGVVGMAGADALSLHRATTSRNELGGVLTERIGFPLHQGLMSWEAGEVLLDTTAAVLSEADAESTQRFAETTRCESNSDGTTAISVKGLDGRRYRLTTRRDTHAHPAFEAIHQVKLEVENEQGWQSLGAIQTW